MAVVLGSQGLTSSKIGFGCMGITAFYGPPMPDDDAVALMKGVYDAGCTHFDTAEIYCTNPGPDQQFNETVVGKFVNTVPRDSVTVATKFNPFLYGGNTDEETVRASFSASAARLGLEYVDLYYCHRMPPTMKGLKEFMESAKKLHAEGKIKAVGLSEVSPAWLREAHAIFPVSAVQQEWSLLTRNLEESLVPCCVELNIAIVAYSPLARNLLANVNQTEPPKDWRASVPRYAAEHFEQNVQLAKKVGELAAAKNATAAQLSLAWLYAQAAKLGVTMVPIPGTTKAAHASTNIASSSLTLSDDDFVLLTELGATVSGPRGNESYLSNAIEGISIKPNL